MSRNNVVVIYPMKTTSGQTVYVVWHDKDSADGVDILTFGEFRARIKGLQQLTSLKCAINVARYVQHKKLCEYSFLVYDGYINALIEANDLKLPIPTCPIRFETNPVYLGNPEDLSTDAKFLVSENASTKPAIIWSA